MGRRLRRGRGEGAREWKAACVQFNKVLAAVFAKHPGMNKLDINHPLYKAYAVGRDAIGYAPDLLDTLRQRLNVVEVKEINVDSVDEL